MRINRASIVQIAALPPGYWLDEHNRCFGMALVELDVQYDDDRADEVTTREVFPLGEDLAISGLTGLDGEPFYLAHALGDDKPFIHYEPDHEEGQPFRR